MEHPMAAVTEKYQALPFGEGAPEGGGRGAVQCIFLLLACGESALRYSLFRLFHLPLVDEKSTFPRGEGFGIYRI